MRSGSTPTTSAFGSEAQARTALAIERERRRRRRARLGLLDYIADVSPDLDRPEHLGDLVRIFERIDRGEQVRAVISAPPQHSKSVTSLHALLWYAQRHTAARSAYATYAQHFAGDQSEVAKPIARRAGLPIVDENRARWALRDGGRISWTSRGGPLTGRPIDGVLLLDDLIKDAKEGNSAVVRDAVIAWINTVALTRVHPGASVVMIATRWHEKDPSGHLIGRGWESVNLPAISDAGEALWPERRPLPYLEEIRRELTDYEWSALYQGKPRPKGGRVFGLASRTDPGDLPSGPYESAWGFDAAYTNSARADWSVAIELRKYHEPERYVIGDVIRMQADPEAMIEALQAREIQRVHWRRAGTEKGLEAFMEAKGIRVRHYPADTDKHLAAQPLAAAWNRGAIEIPARAAWADTLAQEFEAFTGTSADDHDDQIDALVAAYLALGPTRREPRARVLG